MSFNRTNDFLLLLQQEQPITIQEEEQHQEEEESYTSFYYEILRAQHALENLYERLYYDPFTNTCNNTNIINQTHREKYRERKEVEFYLYIVEEEEEIEAIYGKLDGNIYYDEDDNEDKEEERNSFSQNYVVKRRDGNSNYNSKYTTIFANENKNKNKKRWSEVDRDLFERDIESLLISHGAEVEGLRKKVQLNKGKYQQFSKLDKKQQEKFLKSMSTSVVEETIKGEIDQYSSFTNDRNKQKPKLIIHKRDRILNYNASILLFQENTVVALAERLQQITQIFKGLKSYRHFLYLQKNKFRFHFLSDQDIMKQTSGNTTGNFSNKMMPFSHEKPISLQALRLKEMEEERKKVKGEKRNPIGTNETPKKVKEESDTHTLDKMMNQPENVPKEMMTTFNQESETQEAYFNSNTNASSSMLEMILEKENQDLVVELSDELEEYRIMEAKITEIGSMVSYFIDELVSQHADIVSIHENVEISYDNLETGNEELIKAIQRHKNGRRKETLIIFGLALALLILDQIIP